MQLKLDFIKDNKTEVRTFTNLSVKSRALRRAIEINEKIDFSNLKVKDLDSLVDYVCELYHNEFTRDQFYDGLPANLLIETLSSAINGVVGGVTDKLNSFPG